MNSVSFTHRDRSYNDIFEAFWHQSDAYITLYSTNDHEPSRTVSEGLIDLVELLESSRIPVRRVGELNRFDLHKIAGLVGRWQSTFEYASRVPEGPLQPALRAHLYNGKVHSRGICELVMDDDSQWYLVDQQQRQRYKILARSHQDDGDYLFTTHHCWCPSGQVLELDGLTSKKGADLTVREMLEYLEEGVSAAASELYDQLAGIRDHYDIMHFVDFSLATRRADEEYLAIVASSNK